MRSSLGGVHFQWVVFATSRACGGAKGSVFNAQARTRAGDANEMRSAVNPPSLPVGPVHGDESWERAGVVRAGHQHWSRNGPSGLSGPGGGQGPGRCRPRDAQLGRAWLTAWTSPDRAGTTFLHRVVNRARGGPVQSGVLLWVGTVMPGPGFGCETRRGQLRRRFPTASGLPRRGR